MRVYRWTSLAVAGALAAVLLAPAPARAQEVEIKPAAKVKRDKYVILPDEIAEKPDLLNAYDAVKVLRNQWLRITRGSGGGMGSGSMPGSVYKSPKKCGGADGASSDPSCTGSSSGGGSPVPHESGSPYAESGSGMETPGNAGPVLYIDEVKQDKLDELKNLKVADVAEMRYLTGNIAAGRYGAGHENGAILVKTVKFNKP